MCFMRWTLPNRASIRPNNHAGPDARFCGLSHINPHQLREGHSICEIFQTVLSLFGHGFGWAEYLLRFLYKVAN